MRTRACLDAVKGPVPKQNLKLERAVGCDRCVLVEGYAGAIFGRAMNGWVCNFCREFRKPEFPGEQRMVKDLSLRSSEKIGVTVSGGKDSTYVWLRLVENLGPDRVVAINHKKVGLVHPLAEQNLRLAERILGSRLIRLEDYDFLPRFKENLRAWLHKPDAAMVSVALCNGCRVGISGRLFQEATKLGIRKIVNGASYLELAPFKAALMRKKGDGNEMRGLLRGLAENPYYYFPRNLQTMIEDVTHRHTTNLGQGKSRTVYPNIDYVDFFNYLPNVPNHTEKEVAGKLDWTKPTQEDGWHFDCLIEPFKHLLYYGLLGYTEIDYRLSEMVRHNVISRREALVNLNDARQKIIAKKGNLSTFLIQIGSEDLIPQLESFINECKYL